MKPNRPLLVPLPLVLLVLLAACTSSPPVIKASAAAEPAPLILISIDGFHPDYIAPGVTPTLDRLAREGVRAEWMRPSYPSSTFPNHYTLVTGLRPDRHGIVDNTMRDPALGAFALHDRTAVGDGRWWGGEPLWVTVQKAGDNAATMFWPGSEAAIGGVRPRWWHAFDPGLAPPERVDRVLAWLDLPPGERPRFVTLYFEHTDKAGHDHGPGSPEFVAAAALVDRALARLVRGLERRGLAANLVIVSDHGMAAISPERLLIVDDLVDLERVDVVTTGSMIGLDPLPGERARVESDLLGSHGHLGCWRKGELPAQWRYGRHPRVPAIVCQLDTGWRAHTRAQIERWSGHFPGGAHSYAPEAPEMRALFVAHGPAFRQGAVLPAFDNVHVYSLLARLLDMEPADNDGDPAVLAPALRDAGHLQSQP